MNKNETKTKAMSEKVQSVGLFLNKYSKQIAFCMMVCVLLSTTAFATAGTAEILWGKVANLIETWVTRLGGVVMFIGAVMFGLGWQSNDASQKTIGAQTFVGGAIVTAAAALVSTFFN